MDTIDWPGVAAVDVWLDEYVSDAYKRSVLGQDWARVAKVFEEGGEAISELILSTGQNPRKPIDPEAYERLMKELADTMFTALYAIQHFTKSIPKTQNIVLAAQRKHLNRMREDIQRKTQL